MSDTINGAIESIRSSVKKTDSLSEDLLFGLVGYKYFYNEGRFDKTDFNNSFTDGSNDGGIDLCVIILSNAFVPHPLMTKMVVTHETAKMNVKRCCRYNLQDPICLFSLTWSQSRDKISLLRREITMSVKWKIPKHNSKMI